MAWCFSTRASVAIVLIMNKCVYICLWIIYPWTSWSTFYRLISARYTGISAVTHVQQTCRLSTRSEDCCMRPLTWWRHDMETFSASLALCEGKPPVASIFPSQKGTVTQSFDIFSYTPQEMVEQTVQLPVIWNTEMLMWSHCNDCQCSKSYNFIFWSAYKHHQSIIYFR